MRAPTGYWVGNSSLGSPTFSRYNHRWSVAKYVTANTLLYNWKHIISLGAVKASTCTCLMLLCQRRGCLGSSTLGGSSLMSSYSTYCLVWSSSALNWPQVAWTGMFYSMPAISKLCHAVLGIQFHLRLFYAGNHLSVV